MRNMENRQLNSQSHMAQEFVIARLWLHQKTAWGQEKTCSASRINHRGGWNLRLDGLLSVGAVQGGKNPGGHDSESRYSIWSICSICRVFWKDTSLTMVQLDREDTKGWGLKIEVFMASAIIKLSVDWKHGSFFRFMQSFWFWHFVGSMTWIRRFWDKC